MSNYRINTVNTLSTYFAPKGAGLTAAATNIRQAGTDLNALLMGRDNRAGNAVTAISSTGYRVGGVDIINRFNRINPIYDVTIGGTSSYTGTARTATIASRSPSDAGIAPTISALSAINAGTYGPSAFTITLPSGYSAGTYSGTFTITPATLALSSAETPVYSSGSLEWTYVIYLSGVISGSVVCTCQDPGGGYSPYFSVSGTSQNNFSNGQIVIRVFDSSGVTPPTVIVWANSYYGGPVGDANYNTPSYTW